MILSDTLKRLLIQIQAQCVELLTNQNPDAKEKNNGIEITIEYSGYGDSMDGMTLLIFKTPTMTRVQDPLLCDALEGVFDAWNWQEHNGWWNNDGGSGTIRISVKVESDTTPVGGTTEVEWIHNTNYMETRTDTYEAILEDDITLEDD